MGRIDRDMDQISRIMYYERLLNEAKDVLRRYDEALEAFIEAQEKIAELEAYYTGADWKTDFAASENNELPEDLLCGVLSEDGIDHLLDDNQDLLARTGELAGESETDTE